MYKDIIPLLVAKTYLRIDDDQNETDTEILQMISSALSYLESATNVILFARDKTYNVSGGCVDVYDYPINSIDAGTPATEEVKTLSSTFTLTDPLQKVLTLNVGHALPVNVPSEFISIGLAMIKYLYLGMESDKQTGTYPQYIIDMINVNRRFIL